MNIEALIPNVIAFLPEMIKAFNETLIMVAISFLFAVLIGLPLGVVLVATKEKELYKNKSVYSVLSTITDLLRSTPTLILITAITPVTKLIVGTKIGIKGAIVPLVIASAPFLARQIEVVIGKIDKGVIEAGKSMGTSNLGIILRVILPESVAGIVNSLAITFVSLINFSAIAGAVGGGGLGDFAIRYGYNQFKTDIMIVTVIILLLLVSIVQFTGRIISRKLSK